MPLARCAPSGLLPKDRARIVGIEHDEIEHRLQKWLLGFTNVSSGGGENAARYPLRDARVEVREKPGQPGVYGCTIQLQPHYQLDEVGAAFRLVTDLQKARQAA